MDEGVGLGGTDVLGIEVPVVVGGLTAAGPPSEGITIDGTGIVGEDGIIVGVPGDARGAVGCPTAGDVTAGGLAVHSMHVATGGT